MAVHPRTEDPNRSTWTDGRLDDLAASVRDGFMDVDRRFQQVDRRFQQVDRRFEQVDRRFEQVDQRFQHVDARFDTLHAQLSDLHRTLTIGLFGITGTMIAGIIGAIATALIKL